MRYEELTVKEVLDFATDAITERGLSATTCKHFGIRTRYDFNESNGAIGEANAHFFPVTKKGKLVGWIMCNLKARNKKEKWRTIGDVDVTCDLIGQVRCQKKGKELIIAEGMYDAPSIWQAWQENSNDPVKYPCNVVTIGLGTVNAAEHVESNIKFVNGYDTVITAFDGDECTEEERRKRLMRGKEATEAVHCLLGGTNKFAEFPEDCDPSDYLQGNIKGCDGSDLYWSIRNAKLWQHSKVTKGLTCSLDDVLTPIPEGFTVPGFPKLARMVQFRPHECTIVFAPPKAGKTTFTKQFLHECIKGINAQLVCGAFLEDTQDKIAKSFAAIENNVPLYDFMKNPRGYDIDKTTAAYDRVNDMGYFISTDAGHVGPDEAIRLIEYAIKKGCTFVVFDHLSYVMSGDDNENERKALDKLCTSIEALIKKYPVHILCVAHINFSEARYIQAKKYVTDKETGIQTAPFWYEVLETDGRGSRIFGQVFHNMICIDKQYTTDGSRGKTRINVRYNRLPDITGPADILTIKPGTGKLIAVEDGTW